MRYRYSLVSNMRQNCVKDMDHGLKSAFWNSCTDFIEQGI